MRPGPQPGRGQARDARTFVEKAAAAWTMEFPEVPDWVNALAERADESSLNAVGEAIGYSGSLVSQVLHNKYKKGDLGRVEEKVRGALLGKVVWCHGVGDNIARHTCLDWQKKPFAATSPDRTRMYRACRNNCPHFRAQNGKATPADEGGADERQ